MSCKWLLAVALACGSAYAAPADSLVVQSHELSDERPTAVMHAPTTAVNWQGMGHSVASHTSNIIHSAMGMIGVPYRRGGNSAQTGFDCSGFVRAVYADVTGHELPRVARDQAKATQQIAKQDLKPGDLVFFNTMRRAFSHVGIYMGDGKFIHAPSKGKRVRVESMHSKYWSQRFNGARRVELASADSASAAVANLLTVQP